MYAAKRITSITIVALSSLLVLGTGASPAAARQDPGRVTKQANQPTTPRNEGANCPLQRVGTLIEPRGRYVEDLVRQPMPKSGEDLTLILPSHVVGMLRKRRKRTKWRRLDDPVFASSASGGWLWPSNIRTRLRSATADVDGLSGTTPHTLRRTVGTLVAHERGTDAAREQLGHADRSVTGTFYVAKRSVAPDLRTVLDRFFTSPDSSTEPGDASVR
jgi:hypothetical protein